MNGLFDSHAHLHDRRMPDRDGAMERMREAGMRGCVTIGTDLEESRKAAALAERHADVWATAGLHPHDAKDWSPEIEREFRALAQSERVVAIGEIGLDFFRDLSPRETQRTALRAQLGLASELALPVVIHSRDAHEPCFEELAAWVSGGGAAAIGDPVGVLHCFSGDAALAERYAELGFMISFAGPVTYPKSEALRGAAAALPADRIVVETDCPYLPPQSRRGEKNEPAWAAETAALIAELRGDDPAAFAASTTANAARLFRIELGAP